MDNQFIALLQIALGTREILSRVPSSDEWETLFKESQRQAVVGVMVDGLERLPQKQRPPKDMLLQWISIAQINENTYQFHRERARELTTRFETVGFNSCVLKGIGTAQLYPKPARRQCGDIDLWVSGDRREVAKWIKSQCAIGHSEWHHLEAKFFQAVSVEVHFHPGWMYSPWANKHLQKWFDKQVALQMEVDKNLGFAYPTVPFNAVFSLVHSYHHLIEEGLGLRHIIDYYYILKALPAKDKEYVSGQLMRFGLIRFASAMMWVLQEVCGMRSELLICEPYEKEGRFLLDEVMRGGNFGKYRRDNRKRNTISRMFALLPHYPSEVLWVVPWKLWHKCWRLFNK